MVIISYQISLRLAINTNQVPTYLGITGCMAGSGRTHAESTKFILGKFKRHIHTQTNVSSYQVGSH